VIRPKPGPAQPHRAQDVFACGNGKTASDQTADTTGAGREAVAAGLGPIKRIVGAFEQHGESLSPPGMIDATPMLMVTTSLPFEYRWVMRSPSTAARIASATRTAPVRSVSEG
jgi:hypothetical protein